MDNEIIKTTANQSTDTKALTSLKKFPTNTCNKMSCAFLVVLASFLLIGSTYFITKHFHDKQIAIRQNEFSHLVTTDYHNEWERKINKRFKKMERFQNSLLNKLNRSFSMQRNLAREFFNEDDFNVLSSSKSNLVTKESEYVITLEVAGFTKEQISIEIIANDLVITANNQEKNNLRKFTKIISLQRDAQSDQIKSEFKNNILIIHIPRIKPTKQSIIIGAI